MPWIEAAKRVIARGLFLLLLCVAPASALPMTLYANGDAIAGFDADDVAAAVAAGMAEPFTVSGFFGGQGYFSVVTPDGIPGTQGSSKLNPSTGTSTWTLQIADDTPEALLQNFFLVILGHASNDPLPYETENVGLQITTTEPWSLVRNAAATSQVYLAYSLGDLDAGVDYQIPIEYRVGQPLFVQGGEYVFPLYMIAFLSLPDGPQVPEPSVLALLSGALAVGWVTRKRLR